MGQLTDLKEARKLRNRKKNARRFAILTILAVVVASFYLIFEKVKEFDIKTKIDDFVASWGDGPGYPVDIAGREALALFEVSGLPTVINDSNIYVYNQKGKVVANIQHGYNKPVAYASNGRVLNFDLGGTKVKINSASKLIYEKKYDFSVINADISKSGRFCVATESDNYVGEVVVYNKSGDSIFKWYSAENVITNAVLSDDGDYMAVTAINSVNGGLTSFLYIFKITNGTEVAKFTYENELALDITFKTNNAITLLTDKSIKSITTLGREMGEYNFDGEVLSAYSFKNSDNSVLILGNHNQKGQWNIIALDSKNNVITDFKTSEKVKYVFANDENICLSLTDKIVLYNFGGEIYKEIEAPLVRQSIIIGKTLYYTNNTQVNKVDLKEEKI